MYPNIFSSTNYPVLTALLAGTGNQYVSSSPTGGAKIPTVSSAPSSPTAGQIWFSSSAGAFQYYNGTAVQTLGVAGSGISALNVGSSLTSNGVASTSVGSGATLDLPNSGVSANTYSKVTVNSKGIVTYGTGLTESDVPTLSTPGHVIGNAITSGTIGGSTSFYSSGNVTAQMVSSGIDLTRQIQLYDPAVGSAHKITISAPTLTTDYSIVFPATPGSFGYALTTDGSGNLSWANVASNTLPGLAAGKIWVGNSSNVATAVTPYGDINLSIAGSATVTQLQGYPVSAAAPTLAGQILRWNGTAWAPNSVAMSDLRSTVTGTSALTSCSSSQTLVFNSVTDSLLCSSIAIANTQVAWASTGANLVFAGPSTGGAAAPGFRTLTANDLPGGLYDQTYFKQSGNAFGVAAVIGTTDTQSLSLITANAARLTITSSGNIGVGVALPTARLMLAAGAGAPGTSPLKFTSGPVLAAPEPGAVEFDGTSLYYTDSGSVRHALAASGSGISQLTGDVTASGNGSVSSVVTRVNGVIYPASPSLNTVPVVTSAGTVSYVQIPNAALQNNSTTLGSTVLTLGGTANTVGGLTSLGLGINGTTTGVLTLANGSSGGATTLIQANPGTTTAWSLTLPGSAGSPGTFLQTNGSGLTTWASPAGSGTVTSGLANQLAIFATGGSTVSGLTSTNSSVLLTDPSGVPSWNLSSNDNFSQYALLNGRAGGQIWYGGTGASENVTIFSTSNATKGFVLLQPNGGNVGIGTSAAGYRLQVYATGATDSFRADSNNGSMTFDQYATFSVPFGMRLSSGIGSFGGISNATNNYNRMLIGSNVLFGGATYDITANSTFDRAGIEFLNGGDIAFISDASDRSSALHLSPAEWAALTKMQIRPSGRVGIGTALPLGLLDVYGTGSSSAIVIPRDSTANRPSGVNGMIRYNTTNSQIETYSSGAWAGLATESTISGASQWDNNRLEYLLQFDRERWGRNI